MTLETGRIKSEDYITINGIMEAIKNSEKNFNIIINKITKKEKRSIFDVKGELDKLSALINIGPHKTNSIFYIENDWEIEDEEKEFITIDEQIRKFIYQDSRSFLLKEEQVGNIYFEGIRELIQENKNSRLFS